MEILTHDSGVKASYVWPNPAFPFRQYFTSSACRVFIIENIQHNWNWLLTWCKDIRETDYFFVYCGWYHSEGFAKEAAKIFEALGLRKDNFFFMFNSELEESNFTPHDFQGAIINHNAWLDETKTMRVLPDTPKIYDAVYVARRSDFKRHMLAKNIDRLALVAGNNHGKNISSVPENPTYINDAPLTPDGVCSTINQAHCGLILSETEGACFASSEYLLCGVPVVSTPSFGGRDVWYNDYNSIICDPDADSVAEAVTQLKARAPDPETIRQMHIDLAQGYRQRFIDQLALVFDRFGVYDVSAEAYFKEHFMHKMRISYRPDFEAIFGN